MKQAEINDFMEVFQTRNYCPKFCNVNYMKQAHRFLGKKYWAKSNACPAIHTTQWRISGGSIVTNPFLIWNVRWPMRLQCSQLKFAMWKMAPSILICGWQVLCRRKACASELCSFNNWATTNLYILKNKLWWITSLWEGKIQPAVLGQGWWLKSILPHLSFATDVSSGKLGSIPNSWRWGYTQQIEQQIEKKDW